MTAVMPGYPAYQVDQLRHTVRQAEKVLADGARAGSLAKASTAALHATVRRARILLAVADSRRP
ncbi:hypothetical protein [Streptomyces rimosus]|uniref:hypothetical protein n=1 Tax=Streptomyces rimosus TaxID=1927 RepID=UPI0006B29E43|nr:hypothetical protein [Streptomyces rimosus]